MILIFFRILKEQVDRAFGLLPDILHSLIITEAHLVKPVVSDNLYCRVSICKKNPCRLLCSLKRGAVAYVKVYITEQVSL